LNKKIININLYGGPGTGKSTTAAGLFYKMKTAGYKVELVSEFAKELTFSEDMTRLKDQILILGEQHHRLFRLQGKVDYVIHDSPINLGTVYLNDEHIPAKEFKAFINALFQRYDNINFFLERNTEAHGYQEYGRNQTITEAEKIDDNIRKMLTENDIKYQIIQMGANAVDRIFEHLPKI
jgi:predicted ATPase